MNIFQRLIFNSNDRETRLGNPLGDEAAIKRRQNAFFNMTGGRGFRQPKKGVKLSKNGTTRSQREASGKRIYAENLEAERRFRDARMGREGWGLARIRNCIERRDHLKGTANV